MLYVTKKTRWWWLIPGAQLPKGRLWCSVGVCSIQPLQQLPAVGWDLSIPKGTFAKPSWPDASRQHDRPGEVGSKGGWSCFTSLRAGPRCGSGVLSSRPSPVLPCRGAPEASSWPRSPEVLSGSISAGRDAKERPGVPTSKGFGSRPSAGRSGLAIRLR